MKHHFKILALLATLSTALAAPSEINYQGVLTDQQGNPVNGVRAMQIKLYDAPTGGNMTYQQNIGNVTIADGIYSFKFGASGNGIASALNGNDHLALLVDSEEQPTRTKILAVPYALKAKESEDTKILSGQITNISGNLTDLRGIVQSIQQQSGSSGAISDLGDTALLKAAQSSVNINIQNISNSWSDFFTDSNGYYDSVKSSNGLFENYKNSSGFHSTKFQAIWNSSQGNYQAVRTVDFFPNLPLRFIRLFTQSYSRSQFSPSFSYSAKVEYVDGVIEDLGDSISYGYYTDGQNSTRYKAIGRPNISVKKISITYSVSYIIANFDFWINAPSAIEMKIPNDFISNNYKYRVFADATEREAVDSIEVSLSGVWGNLTLNQTEWSELPSSSDYSSTLCLVSNTPALSSEWTKATHVRGIILLRQLK